MQKLTNVQLYVIAVKVGRDNGEDIFTHTSKKVIGLKLGAIRACSS